MSFILTRGLVTKVGTFAQHVPGRYWFGGLPSSVVPGIVQTFNDFTVPSDYVSGDWDRISVGSGSVAQVDDAGGLLTVTTGASTNDSEALFLKDQWRVVEAGRRVWFACRVKLSSIVNDVMQCGLSDGSTANVIAIRLAASSDDIIARCTAGTNVTDSKITDLDISADYVDLAFATSEAATSVDFWVNWAQTVTITTNIPVATNLRTAFQLQTLQATSRSMEIDWFYTANERETA